MRSITLIQFIEQTNEIGYYPEPFFWYTVRDFNSSYTNYFENSDGEEDSEDFDAIELLGRSGLRDRTRRVVDNNDLVYNTLLIVLDESSTLFT